MPRQNRPPFARDSVGRPLHADQSSQDDALDAVPTPEPEAVVPPAPAPTPPRFVALVRIYSGATYDPGDEIPESVAMDGLTEGEHWRRG